MFNCSKCGGLKEFAQGYSLHSGYWYCPHCNNCNCGPDWDPNCVDPLHRQIYDRPIGMTD